jgi:hypothetical protein
MVCQEGRAEMKALKYILIGLFLIACNTVFIVHLTNSFLILIPESILAGFIIGWFGIKHYDTGHF